MDIKNQVYIWVRKEMQTNHGFRLEGKAFDGEFGLGHERTVRSYSGPLAAVSVNASIRFDGNLSALHSARKGWGWLCDTPIGLTPCLLTSNTRLQYVFGGPVDIDFSEDALVAYKTNPIGRAFPVCGEGCIGVLSFDASGRADIQCFSIPDSAFLVGSSLFSSEWNTSVGVIRGLG